ncbi:MAG: diaminopimelate decarboxylase [Clostridiales bacterium]|nr:MAG: diaminopimelate decarboxylase [Clostridiales bacterium]
MFVSRNLDVNEKGHLTIADNDAVDLAKKYGTPLYVMDEDLIRENCRQFRQSFERYYNGAGLACYASKAFCCKEMCRIIAEEGMGLDVVSIGELYTALSVAFPAERIYFHGNNKSDEELRYALEQNIGCIVVDNREELLRLNAMAERLGKKPDIMFRIKPGIDAHTHSFIRTGQIDSKFGLALETGEALTVLKEAVGMQHVHLKGVHCHIGSQIFDLEPFQLAARVMLGFIAQLKQETGFEVEQLNLGGGFGIKYLPENTPVPYDEYIKEVSVVVAEEAKKLGVRQPFILIEPGRSIAGPAGVTLYTVGAVKEIPNIRTYVSVDGGMTDNPRYALYQAEYDMAIANRAAQEKDTVVTVAGKCCESGDLLGEKVPLQQAQAGDILAVFATGAYNYSMASRYNRTAVPPVVMVKNGTSRVVVKRETLEDLVKNDL